MRQLPAECQKPPVGWRAAGYSLARARHSLGSSSDGDEIRARRPHEGTALLPLPRCAEDPTNGRSKTAPLPARRFSTDYVTGPRDRGSCLYLRRRTPYSGRPSAPSGKYEFLRYCALGRFSRRRDIEMSHVDFRRDWRNRPFGSRTSRRGESDAS